MKRSLSVPAAAAALLLTAVACGKGGSRSMAGLTPNTHAAFPITSGAHAVNCTQCHGTGPSFTQFDCLGCHTPGPAAAVHTTTPGYAYDSKSCFGCHSGTTVHPFDHAGVTTCAGCHDAGAFYTALPPGGFAHFATGGTDCSGCHTTASWSTSQMPAGLAADPASAVTVSALVPRFAGTSIASVSAQPQVLPMPMSHVTPQVDLSGLTCADCHASASSGAFYPGSFHSSLANLGRAEPTACSDCHATSAPTGFVGPTATSPARSPASGEMRHEAVRWSGGVPGTTRLVTADCGACHVSPSSALAATWASARSGTGPARYHASLTAASLAQPTSCIDCHANSRPATVLASPAAALPAGLAFDHTAAAAQADCASCHGNGTSAWAGGRFHLAGSATPTSCLPCHAGERPTSTAGWAAGYTASPFDYVTNTDGVTHGDGQDCALCHTGPGTGGAWGGSQVWAGGRFTHGPSTVSGTTCSACHLSQRPDVVLGAAAAATALAGFDHSVNGTGDCIGCHQATVTAGRYQSWYGTGGTFPGGDWKGGAGYPGDTVAGPSAQFVTVTSITLIRSGALVTGTTSVTQALHSGMLHTSPAVPAAVSPGPAASPDSTTCWHCHPHDASGSVTSYAGGVFHASLDKYTATVGGTITPLAQPTGRCGDCHATIRPPGIVELSASDLVPMDHAASFTGTVTIAGQTVTGVAGLDCSTCHHLPGNRWTDGAFHASIGSAVPADCTACHYPLMADGAKANVTSGSLYAMAHGSAQLTFQACATCHGSALASATAPFLATDWRPGAYHPSLASQPTACLDCHSGSDPAAGSPTQSTVVYSMPAGGTASNGGQWMNHGASAAMAADCALCHAADARTSGSAWSKSTTFHDKVASPGTCQACHGLQNGGGSVMGSNNNLPSGPTASSMISSAASDPATSIPAGTHDLISHADVNVSGHDCGFCHTQAGRSTVAGIQGVEWAQARFHTSFPASTPLVLDGSTGRCSNCHLGLKPGTGITAQDHGGFTSVAGSQDCSACHSWPGTGNATAPNWLGATSKPPYIAVGGFPISQPPAASATTQTGITSLPHPASNTCSTCHTGGVGGKNAIGYDHASGLITTRCNACHEAGTNLLGTRWNGATTLAAGAGDSRPYTLGTIVARRGTNGDTCNITVANHFYPVDCGQCHAAPAGNGNVTTGTAYTGVWYFPHTNTNMSNPGTCNMCHVGQGCSK